MSDIEGRTFNAQFLNKEWKLFHIFYFCLDGLLIEALRHFYISRVKTTLENSILKESRISLVMLRTIFVHNIREQCLGNIYVFDQNSG